MKRRTRRPKAARPRSLLLRDRDPEPATQPIRAYPHPGSWMAAPVSAGEWTGTMTVNDTPASAADHMDDRCRAAHTWLGLKVASLKARGMGYRIDENEQAMQRGEAPPAGSVMADALAESVTHLLGDRTEWQPQGGWNHGWAEGLRWYDPQVREPWWDGLPPTPEQLADPAQPWYHHQHLGGARSGRPATRFLVEVITDADRDGDALLAETALRVMASIDPGELVKVITDAISNGNAPLAATALRVLAAVDPGEAQDVLHIIAADLALCDHGGTA